MEYYKFKKILDEKMYSTDFHIKLIKDMKKSFKRFFSEYRISNFHDKLIQNRTQALEIKFGKTMEFIISEYLKENGFLKLENKFNTNDNKYDIDQYFEKNGTYYIVEQKIRDDHDSTKKRGQFDNFKQKINYLNIEKSNSHKSASMYFIDGALAKNKKYYSEEMKKLTLEYPMISFNLFYGKEFFDFFQMPNSHTELLHHINMYKNEMDNVSTLNMFHFNNTNDLDLDNLVLTDKQFLTSLNSLLSNEKSKYLVLENLFEGSDFLSKLMKSIVELDEKNKILRTLKSLEEKWTKNEK